MHRAEVKTTSAALLVALLRAQMFDAAEAFEEWLEEWVYDDELEVDELQELLDVNEDT